MRRIIKIIKAYWFMDPLGYNLLIPIAIILIGLLSVSTCSQALYYINKGETIELSRLVADIVTLNIAYCGFIINTQRVYKLKRKASFNLNNFLIQAPVLKKDIYNAKFIIFQILSIPLFIVVIYFIKLNIFISRSELILSYSGFFVLLYCICTITMNISIGFSSLSSKKYKAFRHLPLVLLLLYVVFVIYLSNIPYVAPGTLVNDQNMFSGLAPRFIPILKACSYIGGFSGLIVILMSTIISYFLGCKLPLKLSEKVSN
jgi:hypothetical protein